jgi:hypothetical protein
MRSFNLSLALCAATALAVTIDTEGLPDTGLDTSAWTTGALPPIEDLVDANDFQIAAKNVLSDKNYAYYRTAALDEITYNANMRDWEKIRLNGFSFTDVSNINTKTSILGYQFDAPFFIAPAAKAGYASNGDDTNLLEPRIFFTCHRSPRRSQLSKSVPQPPKDKSCSIKSTSGRTQHNFKMS